jgi:hypothetical protein
MEVNRSLPYVDRREHSGRHGLMVQWDVDGGEIINGRGRKDEDFTYQNMMVE